MIVHFQGWKWNYTGNPDQYNLPGNDQHILKGHYYNFRVLNLSLAYRCWEQQLYLKALSIIL
jgi:hypothetical protein